MKEKIKYLGIGLLAIILLAVSIFSQPIRNVRAVSSLTSQSITFSTYAVSTAATETISFVATNGVAASSTITITYPSAWTGLSAITTGDVTMSDNGSAETMAATTTPGSSQVGFYISSAVLTLKMGASTSVASGHTVVIVVGSSTHKITNPDGSANPYNINLASGSDTGQVTGVFGNNIIAVSATVNQSMSFSVITTSVTLSPALSSTSTGVGSGTMSIGTNASGGFIISVSGSTLAYGSNTIAAMATAATSTQGSAQFGLNLVANTSPSVGAAATGTAPIGTAATNYNTANNFRFVTGDTVASYSTPANTTTFTVSYMANVIALQAAGTYTTTLTYTATSTF